MTGTPTDPTAFDAAAMQSTLRALSAARTTTRGLAAQLLTHLPDVGDFATQRALDAWVEQAADTLRALSEMLEERLLELGRATPAAPTAGTGLSAVSAVSPSAGGRLSGQGPEQLR